MRWRELVDDKLTTGTCSPSSTANDTKSLKKGICGAEL